VSQCNASVPASYRQSPASAREFPAPWFRHLIVNPPNSFPPRCNAFNGLGFAMAGADTRSGHPALQEQRLRSQMLVLDWYLHHADAHKTGHGLGHERRSGEPRTSH
jgi:hypothetical protein